MSLKAMFAVPTQSRNADLGFLLLRVVAGLAFVRFGSGKIQNPMEWMGPDTWAPGILQALAAISEFGGGLAWILGLLTPLASLGIACTMSVAFCTHAFQRGDPFVNMTGGMASYPAAIFFCIAVLLIAAGPGRLSLDRLIFGTRDRA